MMNDRIPKSFQLEQHGISARDIVRFGLGCEPAAIQPSVVVTPVWHEALAAHRTGKKDDISAGRVCELTHGGRLISFIRSGIGAPVTGDTILALGCTPCERVVFTGSVGGLSDRMGIGDLLLVEQSVCGEGFSRYLASDAETPDRFSEIAQPDVLLTQAVGEEAQRVCEREGITLHKGRVFAIDTIVAQFPYLRTLNREYDCIGIEMETSAVFNAARVVGIRAAALLQVSDLPMSGRSLFSGRSVKANERRRYVRSTALPEIILEALTRILPPL